MAKIYIYVKLKYVTQKFFKGKLEEWKRDKIF